MEVFIHPSSYVDEGVEIGSGTKIWHFSHILRNTKIGKNCIMPSNFHTTFHTVLFPKKLQFL